MRGCHFFFLGKAVAHASYMLFSVVCDDYHSNSIISIHDTSFFPVLLSLSFIFRFFSLEPLNFWLSLCHTSNFNLCLFKKTLFRALLFELRTTLLFKVAKHSRFFFVACQATVIRGRVYFFVIFQGENNKLFTINQATVISYIPNYRNR
jgi:hypothetical protein